MSTRQQAQDAKGLGAKALGQNAWSASATFTTDATSGSPKLQNNAATNTLLVRNASSSGWAAIAFNDSSASHGGSGKERLAIGYYNPTDASGFSAANYIETSNDPVAGVTTNAPTPLRFLQTGYLNSAYQIGTMRQEFSADGTIKFSDWNGNLIMTMPLLNTSPMLIVPKLQLGGTTSSNPMLKPNGSTIEIRAADDSGAAGLQAFSYGVKSSGFLGASANGVFTFSNTSGTQSGVRLTLGPSGPIWAQGAGSPESSVTAPIGSLYSRTDGGASTTLYVKESGVGNTGWVAK